MSKSYNNTLTLRESAQEIDIKIRRMPTDPARIKLTDAGNPNKCPVWQLHTVYSDEQVRDWVIEGCAKAKIGCVECKQPIIKAVQAELAPMQARIFEYQAQSDLVTDIIEQGSKKARIVARETLGEVREAMGICY
jgi:tryptophanyl-tRNA synthetase